MEELKEYVNELLTEQDSLGGYDISSDSKKEILYIINKFEKKLLNLINTNNIKEEED